MVTVSATAAAPPEYVLDSNTAFYEGEVYAYVVSPPASFKLFTEAAADDGYSFAFIPESQAYDSADVQIGVTVMKLGANDFDSVVAADTIQLREHYGDGVTIRAVDSLFDFHGTRIPTVYVDDKSRFIPTVMVSYCDGGSEIVIFELIIVEGGIARFLAEAIYTQCLQRFKMLKKGELDLN
jgi:hypothetical protein